MDARSKSLTGRGLKPAAPASSSWAGRASPATAAATLRTPAQAAPPPPRAPLEGLAAPTGCTGQTHAPRADADPITPSPHQHHLSPPSQPPIVWAVMWPWCGRSRVVNPLAAGDGGTSRDTGPAELISCQHPADNLTEP